MKGIIGLIALCGAIVALPAMAQETPYQTNMNKSAAAAEARAARGGDLTAVTPQQALNNALQRCDPLPEYYKTDCIARVKGQGEGFGSVTGGGIFMESKTTLPAGQLQDEQKNIGPVQLPPQQQQSPAPSHKRMHKKHSAK